MTVAAGSTPRVSSVTVTNLSPGGIQGTVFNDQNGDGIRNALGDNPVPPGGPFLPDGTPFPAIGLDTGPAIIVTIGPGGTITTNSTGQGPYDGADDTYVAVINQANSGVAVQSLKAVEQRRYLRLRRRRDRFGRSHRLRGAGDVLHHRPQYRPLRQGQLR